MKIKKTSFSINDLLSNGQRFMVKGVQGTLALRESIDALKSVNEKLMEKSVRGWVGLEKSVEEPPRGLYFDKTGKQIAAGLDKKLKELEKKLVSLKEASAKAKEANQLDKTEAPVSPGSGYGEFTGRVRDCEYQIEKLKRVRRNLDESKTYRLEEWTLENYGL